MFTRHGIFRLLSTKPHQQKILRKENRKIIYIRISQNFQQKKLICWAKHFRNLFNLLVTYTYIYLYNYIMCIVYMKDLD